MAKQKTEEEKKQLRKLLSGSALLDELEFSPIEAMLDNYNKLTYQIERFEKIQSRELVIFKADGISERYYNEELHMSLMEKRAKISESLLRYKYARVPETTNVNTTPPVMHVHLTRKGESVKINE